MLLVNRVSGHFWAVLIKSGTEVLLTLKGWSSDPILVLYEMQWLDTLLYRRTVPGARSLARKSANHNSCKRYNDRGSSPN